MILKKVRPLPLNPPFPFENYVRYGCTYVRKIPVVSLSRRTGAYHWSKNVVAVITQGRVIHDNLKGKLKMEPCVLVDYFC